MPYSQVSHLGVIPPWFLGAPSLKHTCPSGRAGPCSRGLPSAIADCMLGAGPGARDSEADRLFPGSPFLLPPLEGPVLSAVLLSLYPSSCLVEANFLPPQFLSLVSFQVLFLSFLISLFCLTYFVEIFCLLLLLVIRVFFDSWCVGACFLFWGVQRDLSAICQVWLMPWDCSGFWGSAPSPL